MSVEQDLLNLKAKGEQLNTLKIQNATKLAALEEEKNKLLIEAEELGIIPDKIKETLESEELSIKIEVNKLTEDLNRILGEISAI